MNDQAFDRRRFLGIAAAGAVLGAAACSTTAAPASHAGELPPAPPPRDFITWHEFPLVGLSPVATALATDAAGRVWYADYTHRTVVRVDPTAGSTTEFVTGDVVARLCPTPDGRVWFSSAFTDRIGVLDPATGSVAWFAAPDSQAMLTPSSTGELWFDDPKHGGVARIDASGVITSVSAPGSPTVSSLAGAVDGTIWFATDGSADLTRYDPLAGSFTTVRTALAEITGLAATPAGAVWAAGPGALQRFALDGSVTGTAVLPPGAALPRMLVAGVHAELFFRVTDLGIGRVNPDHSLTFMLPPFERAAPMGLAVTPAGSVWFLHRFRETLGWF
ncbi:hypothetical protein N1031_12110 [Herbiconiux moechotypicola]|uniref:Twin-arginine translocation signal domain-containing protein n=1 Tax=Herbiconiux moechotypicola TaxID=637393 RepID=A0ABN3DTT6_9MICO|nr:hypothetical protein [Herbiconiux moechotypicola]MCS5730507.1 hypothetical protein [Herbiconiux moechotypicola]